MALTDIRVRQLKPLGAASGEKYANERGLYLDVTATGKYWRPNHRFAVRQKTWRTASPRRRQALRQAERGCGVTRLLWLKSG